MRARSRWASLSAHVALLQGEGRAGRAARGSIASAAARIVTAVSSIISVPILLGYLGLEAYGLWVTAYTLMAWVGLAHVGLPMSLLNKLAAVERDQHETRAALASTAWWLSVALAAVSLGLLLVLGASGAWSVFSDVSSNELQSEARLFVVVMWIGAALTVPLLVPMAVLGADEQVDKVALVNMVGVLARLAGVLLVVHLDGGVVWLVIVSVGAPILFLAIAATRVFGRRVSWPRPRLFNRRLAQALVAAGVGFLGISIAAMATTSIDVLLIAQLLGAAAVTTYSVAFALLVLFLGIGTAVLEGYWPAYAIAASQADERWIRRANRTVTAGFFVASVVFATGLVLSGSEVIEAWAGPQAVPPTSLLVVFGAIALVQSVELPHNRVLVATGHIRRATSLGIASAAINVPVSVVLSVPFGVTGVAAGTLVASIAITLFVVRSARRAMEDVGRAPPGSLAGASGTFPQNHGASHVPR